MLLLCTTGAGFVLLTASVPNLNTIQNGFPIISQPTEAGGEATTSLQSSLTPCIVSGHIFSLSLMVSQSNMLKIAYPLLI